MSPLIINTPAPGVSFFTPAQDPPAGSAKKIQPNDKPIPTLFQPLKIRGLEVQNRIFLSPLCQYSAENGFPTPWHLAHLGGIISRGPGLSFTEATAVLPEARISPQDLGIWSDEHAAALAKIVEFAHSQNQKIGIQLAHAGRKASTLPPWLSGRAAVEAEGGWLEDVWGPSTVPYSDTYPKPKELTTAGIKSIVTAFADAAIRSVKAGFDAIEIHNAHGYLLHEFCSPMSNKRTDEYGGSFENRTRFTLEVVDAIRAVIPNDMPLALRISATDWLEESLPNEPSWRIEDTVRLAHLLVEHGVDFLDVSSGALHPKQKIKTGPAYQAPFAAEVKKALGSKLLVGSVGSITDGHIAQGVLDKGQADVALVGRMFQKNPGTVWTFAEDLGVQINLAQQIDWAFSGRAKKVNAKF